MKCERCSGLMVYEKIYAKDEFCWSWHCILCGSFEDETILANRNWQLTTPLADRTISVRKQYRGRVTPEGLRKNGPGPRSIRTRFGRMSYQTREDGKITGEEVN